MEVALARLLDNDAWFLQKIVVDVSTNRIAFEIKVNVHVLAEPWGIVVPIRFGIAERFQNCVRLKKNVFHSANESENGSLKCLSSPSLAMTRLEIFVDRRQTEKSSFSIPL